MIRPTGRLLWLLIRVVVYLGVAAALLMTRLGAHRPGGGRYPPLFPGRDSSLVIAGRDLAPGLIGRLVADYRQDYPRLRIRVVGGGTAQGLEALANGQADVSFLIRPPTTREQGLFRSAGRDTALWFPVALGGIRVVRGEDCPVESLRVDDLRRFLRGGTAGPFDRLYVPDPNSGLWDAFTGRLELPADSPGPPDRVVYLQGEAEVIAAVRADRRGLGLVSSLGSPGGGDIRKSGLKTVPVAAAAGGPAASPTYEEIGYGRYPLYHYLYAACRPEGGIPGSMFLTHLTSDRGQRQVERAGFLPVRQVLREIHLTTHPVGQPR